MNTEMPALRSQQLAPRFDCFHMPDFPPTDRSCVLSWGYKISCNIQTLTLFIQPPLLIATFFLNIFSRVSFCWFIYTYLYTHKVYHIKKLFDIHKSDSNMTSANNQRYEEFVSDWIAEKKIQVRDLQSALESGMDDEYLQTQVLRVLGQYERYYNMRAEAAERNVLAMFYPTWNNPLENAFLWIGGWRPSMIFQLAYAEIGQQLETELAELLRGINSSTLAALSSKQLYQINKLQCETLVEEDKLSEKMAVLQRSLADGPLLSLAQVAFGASSLESVLEGKVQKLQKLLIKADRLRFETMKRMLEILTPCQSVQILITAAQLHLCLHNKRY